MSTDTTTTTRTRRPTQISYNLPGFDSFQSSQPQRTILEATAYVDGVDVGRGVFLSGSVHYRTVQGRPDEDGWAHYGWYLYRVSEDGSYPASTLEPTQPMVDRLRTSLADLLEPPSDNLRLRTALRLVESRNTQARAEYERTSRDTALLLTRFEDAMGIELGTVAQTLDGID